MKISAVQNITYVPGTSTLKKPYSPKHTAFCSALDGFYEQLAVRSRKPIPPIKELDGKIQKVNVKTADGLMLEFLDIKSDRASKNYVLFLHGINVNAMDLQYQNLYKDLTKNGVNVLALEYRGFGPNKGKVEENGIMLDAKAGYDYLIQKGAAPKDIAVVGHSLGGTVACRLAAQKDIKFLVLDSTFNNPVDIAQALLKSQKLGESDNYFRLLGTGAITTENEFSIDKNIQHVRCPILFVHCENDNFVPLELAQKLERNVSDGVRHKFVTIPNCATHEITPQESEKIAEYAAKEFTP